MKNARRVLVTGANGLIGSIVRRQLAEEYELSYLTRKPAAFGSHVADLSDLAAIRPAFSGKDAVVHLAASSSVTSSWDEVLANNIIATRNVFEAAREAGVDRVVFASSNHVIGMYERDGMPRIYDLDDRRIYDDRVPVRPDSLYGASKAFGEALGRFYHDMYGIAVVCLRIGSVRATATSEVAAGGGGPTPMAEPGDTADRLQATWLSHRDCAQLIRSALNAETRWAIVYGISNNPRQFWDLSGARSLLGYEPQDAAPSTPRSGGTDPTARLR